MAEQTLTSRQLLLQEVKESFNEANYQTTEIRRSVTFDIVAKSTASLTKDYIPILTKVLKNLDNFKIQHSKEMELLSKLLGAAPLLIAQYYKNRYQMQDELVYNRHNINAINLQTLKKLLNDQISPHKIAVRGSRYSIRINNLKLTEYLKKTGKAQTQISNELAVSRQSLLNYQKGNMLPSEQIFQKIVEFIDNIFHVSSKLDLLDPYPLMKPKSPIEPGFENRSPKLSSLQIEVEDFLNELNYQQFWFKSLPWDGISQERKSQNQLSLFSGVDSHSRPSAQLNKRINETKLILSFLNQKGIWIMDNEEAKQKVANFNSENRNLRIMHIDELTKIKNKKEFKKQIESGGNRQR